MRAGLGLVLVVLCGTVAVAGCRATRSYTLPLAHNDQPDAARACFARCEQVPEPRRLVCARSCPGFYESVSCPAHYGPPQGVCFQETATDWGSTVGAAVLIGWPGSLLVLALLGLGTP